MYFLCDDLQMEAREHALSFHHVGFGGWTHAARLGSEGLCLLSHLTVSIVVIGQRIKKPVRAAMSSLTSHANPLSSYVILSLLFFPSQ